MKETISPSLLLFDEFMYSFKVMNPPEFLYLQFGHDKLEAEYFKERAKLEVAFQKSSERLHNQVIPC